MCGVVFYDFGFSKIWFDTYSYTAAAKYRPEGVINMVTLLPGMMNGMNEDENLF